MNDGVLVICVQQHLIQTLLHGVCADEIRSLLSDELFKSATRSRMIGRSHVILLQGWRVRRSAVLPAPSDAASLADSEPQNLPFLSLRAGSNCTCIQGARAGA